MDKPKPRLKPLGAYHTPGYPTLYGVFRTPESKRPIAMSRSLTKLAKARIFKENRNSQPKHLDACRDHGIISPRPPILGGVSST